MFKFGKTSYLIIIVVSLLSVCGIISISSATHSFNKISNELSSQLNWIILGFLAVFIFSIIDHEILSKSYFFIYIFNLVLLLGVIFFGKNINNSTRWLKLGKISIQPSEFSKIFMIISLSGFAQNRNINKIKNLFLSIILVLIPVAMILKQPSLSSAVTILSICFAILFAAGLKYNYILKTILFLFPAILFLAVDLMLENHIIIHRFLKKYQITRIVSLFKTDKYSQSFYQTRNSILAIGSGKIFGHGFYGGTINKLNYLPESHNDFIFSVIGEDFGFLGCVLVLFLFSVLIILILKVAKKSKTRFTRLILSGVASMFGFQVFVNIGVSIGILPNTGMSLPFISYGGSSTIANMICIGIILNIIKSYKL
ncbi:MAG: rod shape-determining protein RodA [Clostridiales bacterium]|jgi:rod shape determining protein RodA|nr:rod shape-determining protein RodA [Clostridiales bacterium]